MNVLIGDTGLVGKTLTDSINFDLTFNSKTIESISSYNLAGSNLYLSCLPATKWMINQNPILDFINMSNIVSAISKNEYSKIVLISTIDVYGESPLYMDESFSPIVKSMCYGSNRYAFELAIKKIRSTSIDIFRLPALFGKYLKKNILFDLLHSNGVEKINYNSKFQWYNLSRLTSDISQHAGQSKTVNLFTEPIETSHLLKLFNVSRNDVDKLSPRIEYDWRTNRTESGYIQSKDEVFSEIINFINAYRY
jgi:hypothetical protein